jgi:hypothetical protein
MIGRRAVLAALGLGAGGLFLPSVGRGDEAPPRRLAVFFTVQGTVPWRWAVDPEQRPADAVWTADLRPWSESDLGDILGPLHSLREQVTVVDGLGLVSAEADGRGHRHERGQLHSLSGSNVAWIDGRPVGGAPTIDQLVANAVSRADRHRSLELSVGGGLAYDDFGSVIHRARNQPLPPIDAPQVLWERLFGTEVSASATARQASVLDAVARRYDVVASELSADDRHKLEVHRDLVREVEQRVTGLAAVRCAAPELPAGGSYDEDFAAHLGLVTAALSCDLTRVVSLQIGPPPPQRIGAASGDIHTDYAHDIYERPDAEEVMVRFNRYHAEQFATLLRALDAVPEGEGSLLDSTLVVWLSEMADGWHAFDRYPAVIAGGGGVVALGRWLHYPRTTPFDALQYEPDGRMGVPHQRFLITVAHAMGAGIDALPVTSVRGSDGTLIDCTRPLPELLA